MSEEDRLKHRETIWLPLTIEKERKYNGIKEDLVSKKIIDPKKKLSKQKLHELAELHQIPIKKKKKIRIKEQGEKMS